MFARAFSCYVHDKIEMSGGRSDYLCGHSEMTTTLVTDQKTGELFIVSAVPQGEERIKLNQCFDDMFNELRELGYLHEFHYEMPEHFRRKEYPSLSDIIRNTDNKKADYNISLTIEEKGKNKGQLSFDFFGKN